jgi:GT2 family glycosyltransferase
MQSDPVVTFLIASYNTTGLLDECLSSVFALTRTSFEVIVVDDASTDGSPAMVREKYPQVRLFINDRNLGFVKTNNLGVRRALGRYVLLLNSDTRLVNDAASILATYLDNEPAVGACGGTLKNADGTSQISFGAFPSFGQAVVDAVFMNDLFPRAGFPKIGAIPDGKPAGPMPVDYISGADLMLRRVFVEQFGLFDDLFEAYCEEVDLCYRIHHFERQHVAYVPEAQIVHYGGASYGKLGKRRISIQYQSYDKFLTKHHGSLYAACTRLLYAWHYAVKSLLRAARALFASAATREDSWGKVRDAMYIVRYSLLPPAWR